MGSYAFCPCSSLVPVVVTRGEAAIRRRRRTKNPSRRHRVRPWRRGWPGSARRRRGSGSWRRVGRGVGVGVGPTHSWLALALGGGGGIMCNEANIGLGL